MPYSWEKSLGEAVDSQLLSLFGNTCAKPKGTAALAPAIGQSGDFAGTRGKGETRRLQPFLMGRNHR
jgi:hypothetical protein